VKDPQDWDCMGLASGETDKIELPVGPDLIDSFIRFDSSELFERD
jgi:hypothetical protein